MKRRNDTEPDPELLARQETMFKIDQARNREPDPATPEQVERFEKALAKYRGETEAQRSAREGLESAKKRVAENHGFSRASSARETPEPAADDDEDVPPPPEVI